MRFSPNNLSHSIIIGPELRISGAMIYNGLRKLDSIDFFDDSCDTFEVLYFLTIGIERLVKVALIYTEISAPCENLEKSIISHNVFELHNRWRKSKNLEPLPNPDANALLQLLSCFYKTHRYSRFSLSRLDPENGGHQQFLDFILERRMNKWKDKDLEFYPLPNSMQFKRWFGRLIWSIINPIKKYIDDVCFANNIFIDEFFLLPKARWVFLRDKERMNFTYENHLKREALYWIYCLDKGDNQIENVPPLPLDVSSIQNIASMIFQNEDIYTVTEEFDSAYRELESPISKTQRMAILESFFLGPKSSSPSFEDERPTRRLADDNP